MLIFYIFYTPYLLADNHNIYETIEQLQKDIKTLERAVYSDTNNSQNNNNSTTSSDINSEDVLTRHLLKLSEIDLPKLFEVLMNIIFLK